MKAEFATDIFSNVENEYARLANFYKFLETFGLDRRPRKRNHCRGDLHDVCAGRCPGKSIRESCCLSTVVVHVAHSNTGRKQEAVSFSASAPGAAAERSPEIVTCEEESSF